MGKVLAILGGGTLQLPAIDAAKRMGCEVLVLDPRPDAPGAASADWFHTVDLGDTAACLAQVEAHRASGVITLAADFPVPTVAAICEALGLPGLTPASAEAATDKLEMRLALWAADVPVPRFALCQSRDETIDQAGSHADALVLKPADSSGGRGVVTLGPSASENDVIAAYRHACGESRSKRVLVEALVEGPEISVEAITIDGETRICAVTDKFTTGRPHWVEIGHSQPSEQPEALLTDVERITRRAIKALGIDHSASHTEIKLTHDGPVVIEVGGRLGGGFITSDLVPLSTGIDMVGATIRVAVGELPALTPSIRAGAAVRFLTAKSGTVSSITGLSAARRTPGVVRVALEAKCGDRVPPLTDATGRIGHVIAQAGNAAEARAIADRAANAVNVDTDVVEKTTTRGFTRQLC